MSYRDQHKTLLIGIILLFIIGIIFTDSAKGQENSIIAIPLPIVSSYQQLKDDETGEHDLNSLPTTSANSIDETPTGNEIPVPFPEAEISFEKVCDPLMLSPGEETFCTITIENNSSEDFSYKILDFMSRRMTIQEESIVGGTLIGHNLILHRGELASGTLPSLSIEKIDTPLVYNSLQALGVPPLVDMEDEAMINVATLEPYVYAEEEYTTVGIASNGYLIPGLGSDEDIAYIPQIFPDPAIPNNVVAPFWTDLNPEVAGNIYAALLTRDDESWVVIEWEDVPDCDESCDNRYTFQAWLKTNTVEQDITFIYARVDGLGNASGLNVGVEDNEGIQGANYESVPIVDDELVVNSTPGTDGETHTISYTAEAERSGLWFGCALTKVFSFQGIAFDCVYGEITE